MFTSLWKSLTGRFDLGRREALHRSRTRKNHASLNVTVLEERALMAAGLPDNSFGMGDFGQVTVAFDAGGQNTDHAAATAVQSDGKIVVVGWAQGPNGDHDFAITRLNVNGFPDTSFGSPGNHGRVLVAFDNGGSKNDEAYAVAIQNDGKIVVAGRDDSSIGDSDMAVVRLNPDGSLDTANFGSFGKMTIFFDLGGSNSDAAFAVAMKGDKIVLAGAAQTGFLGSDMAVAQLETDGTLDLNFNTLGVVVNGKTIKEGRTVLDFGGFDLATGVAIQGTKIIVAGNTTGDMAVARLTGGGILDQTFGPNMNGRTTVAFNLGGNNADTCSAVAIQTDGKVVLAGSAERSAPGDFDFAVARLTADGLPDGNFAPLNSGKKTIAFNFGGNNKDVGNALTLQPDGKIVVAGTVVSESGDTDFGVTRLDTSGNLDSTFGGGSGLATAAFDRGGTNADAAAGVALQTGGRIVVVGTIERATPGNTDFGVVRLLGDPPPAPTLTNPAVALTVSQNSFLLQGGAAAGSLVRVYRDVNNDNQVDIFTDHVVGQQQLDQFTTSSAISVPLIPNAANNFLVTATWFNSDSTPTDVPTLRHVPQPLPGLPTTPEGVVARVVRKKRKSVVQVRGAVTGELRRTFGPYAGRVRALLRDINQDGVLDLVIQSVQRGKKELRAYDGVSLAALPLPSNSKM